jgi:hypothetical protein
LAPRTAAIVCILYFSVSLFASETRNKVEELFIWKISDELKLSVPEEKSLAELIRTLNQRRTRVNEDLQETLKKMSSAQSSSEREKTLAEHRKLLKSYSDLSIEEADRVQKIFGTEKASRYFVLKNDLTNRLKTMLAAPETKTAEKLGPPKIIEEN